MKYAYIGTWKNVKSKLPGKVLVFKEAPNGKMKKIQEVILEESVSKIRVDQKKGLLFASLEAREGRDGSCGGEICIFQIEDDGTLNQCQKLPSLGAYPIDFSMTDDFLAIVNHGSTTGRICRTRQSSDGKPEVYWEYDEASLVLYERTKEGRPERFLDRYKFTGSGKIPFFQESAAPHSISYIPETGLFLVPCRGTDETVLFRAERQKLVKQGVLKAKTGQGPRNAAAAKNGRDIYIVGEIEALVSRYTFPETEPVQTESVVTEESAAACSDNPCSFEAPHPSDLQISRDEKWIYVLTRSTESLSVFSK
ncbi:MAG TPA: beta-propeller fold lactonase family protein [Candidatus Choladousia intestinavium]|uniref:Beta-propeller fold lactonase family protein n=1 Tax=Candidatus Choladousia intestinavium TaxID=2840727 RepID=A0A9D1AAK2_9FIRM|nr:beta-propeller fold lactonase family protein [Candidatus Choladousia intestinavium]